MQKLIASMAALLGGIFITQAAHADVTDHFSKSWQECITYGESHNTIAIPENDCNEKEFSVQDAKLNQAYKMVMVRLTAARKFDLRSDERNWIIARDQRCKSLNGDDETGECLIDETMKRIVYLERIR